MTHPIHFLGDQEAVSETFKEGERLGYGKSDVYFLFFEVLEKVYF